MIDDQYRCVVLDGEFALKFQEEPEQMSDMVFLEIQERCPVSVFLDRLSDARKKGTIYWRFMNSSAAPENQREKFVVYDYGADTVLSVFHSLDELIAWWRVVGC